MATYEAVKTLTMIAGEDFDADSLYELVALDGGKVVKADGNHSDLNRRVPIGILAVNAAKTDQPVTIIDLDAGGIGKVKANAAIAQDALVVASNTAGKADDVASIAALAADQISIGVALEAASAADEIISFKIGRIVAPHSA